MVDARPSATYSQPPEWMTKVYDLIFPKTGVRVSASGVNGYYLGNAIYVLTCVVHELSRYYYRGVAVVRCLADA